MTKNQITTAHHVRRTTGQHGLLACIVSLTQRGFSMMRLHSNYVKGSSTLSPPAFLFFYSHSLACCNWEDLHGRNSQNNALFFSFLFPKNCSVRNVSREDSTFKISYDPILDEITLRSTFSVSELHASPSESRRQATVPATVALRYNFWGSPATARRDASDEQCLCKNFMLRAPNRNFVIKAQEV